MSDAATTTRGTARTGEAAVLLFLFALIAGAITLRIVITNPLMNEFVEYTTEFGAIYEKIHFGTYALFAAAALVPVFRPIRLDAEDIAPFRALLAFAAWVLGLSIVLIVIGRGGSAGYFIDSYLAAAIAGLLVFMLPPAMRRVLGKWIVVLLFVSAFLGIFELATQSRVLPYAAAELQFRPTGLMGHPLNQGLMMAAGIGFLTAAPFGMVVKLGGALLLLVGAAAAGARTATIFAGLALFACLMLTQWRNVDAARQQSLKVMVLAFAIIAVIPAVALLLGAGLLGRFEDGLFDESAMARLDVWQVFRFVSWRDILVGTDIAVIQNLVETRLDLAYIESTPLILIFQLGLPGALVFTGLMVYLFAHLLRRSSRAAIIGTAVFFVVALSNNHLSTKMATMTMVVVMLVALMEPARPRGFRLR